MKDNIMNELKRLETGYYTQIEYELPIEQRIFVKQVRGVKATMEYYRIATDEEITAWKEYQAQQNELNHINME